MKARSKQYAKNKVSDDPLKKVQAELMEQLDNLKRTGPLLSQDGQAAVDRLTELVKALDQG